MATTADFHTTVNMAAPFMRAEQESDIVAPAPPRRGEPACASSPGWRPDEVHAYVRRDQPDTAVRDIFMPVHTNHDTLGEDLTCVATHAQHYDGEGKIRSRGALSM